MPVIGQWKEGARAESFKEEKERRGGREGYRVQVRGQGDRAREKGDGEEETNWNLNERVMKQHHLVLGPVSNWGFHKWKIE